MVYRPDIRNNLCFVLIPFQPSFFDYYEGIIKPAAKELGLEAEKSDEIYGTGAIIHDIWGRLWQAAVVVADVTDKNPNVNYELGLCHALGVPTVLITQNIDDVPFDYRHRRCILYDRTKLKWEENLRQSITLTIQKVLSGEDRAEDLRWPYDTSLLKEGRKIGSFDSSDAVTDIVIEGAALVAKSVAQSLGPHGLQVSLRVGKSDEVAVTRGFAIAFGTRSDDPRRMAGISRMQRVAADMRDSVGDGTKLAIILSYEMLAAGRKAAKQGYSVRDVIYGMDAAVERAAAAIAKTSKSVSADDLLAIGRTAAGGDVAIAQTVLDAFRSIGKDGLMYIEESSTPGVQLHVQAGMHFDRGFLSPDFVTEEKHQKTVLNKPYVLICDYKLSSMKELLPLLEQIARTKSSLLIVADDVEGEALATLSVNKRKGTLICVPVRAPGYGDRRRAILEDIAVLTGGTLVSRESGYSLQDIQLSQLGRAKEIVVTKDGTTVSGGFGSGEAIEARAEGLRAQIQDSPDDAQREKLMERLARLVGGVAIIRVGGINRQEITDRKGKAVSAMHACRAGIEEGLVPGAGLALLNASTAVQEQQLAEPSQTAGRDAVIVALRKPLKQQIENAKEHVEEIVNVISTKRTPTVGFNAYNRRVEDLLSAGVVDPTKLILQSMRIAFAHARVILQTGAWAFSTEDQETMPAVAPMGDLS